MEKMNNNQYRERRMRFLVIHASHTPQGVECGSVELPIRPHYYVRRNGVVERLLPRGEAGRHCPGFNRHSVGVCYEGGLDREGRTSDTRTVLQCQALHDLVCLYLNVYPGMKLAGPRQFTAGTSPTDPGFNVPREYGEWVKIPKYNLRKLAGR